MPDWNEHNNAVIAEFRANAGKVGGRFEGAPVLLLTTTGTKSGLPRTNPLMYLDDGDRLLVFASKGGAPEDPDWYRNLLANPEATVEVGTETFAAKAVAITGAERDRLYARQAERYPQFAEYQAKVERSIPVVALERLG